MLIKIAAALSAAAISGAHTMSHSAQTLTRPTAPAKPWRSIEQCQTIDRESVAAASFLQREQTTAHRSYHLGLAKDHANPVAQQCSN